MRAAAPRRRRRRRSARRTAPTRRLGGAAACAAPRALRHSRAVVSSPAAPLRPASGHDRRPDRRRTTGAAGWPRPTAGSIPWSVELVGEPHRLARPCRGAATSPPRTGCRRPAAARSTACARWRNPPSMPANAWKNATASASTSEPTTLPMSPQHRLRGEPDDPHAGPRRQHHQLEQPVVEEAGEHARSLEEVEGVAARRRVDHHEVEAVVGVQQVQRLGRHVLLGAAQRAGDVR